jgi:AcrR family transcriptional regulator
VDQRLARGARSRQAILRHAVDVASLEGLSGLSLGRLAGDLGISKSGVQTLFGAKEKLQVAAAECAHGVFVDEVVRPALKTPRGAARSRALVSGWLDYAATPLFPGGCFWAANLADFDSRPGPVRDILFGQRREWVDLLAGELRHAEVADVDLAVFQLDAVLLAANTALRLDDRSAVDKVGRVLDGLLTR